LIRRRLLAALMLASSATAAQAGPPYFTDDPVPTDLSHWEIYAFTAAEGRGAVLDADVGVDLNYGAAKDLQLTATVPLSLSHDRPGGWRSGTGDLEVAAKYRFVHDERSGISVAAFPRAILPTASHAANAKTRILLPVWAEKDFAGGTSLFGGGGYEINPGRGNRNFWQAGAAVTHDLSDQLSLGAELTRQGRDKADRSPQTSAGIGAILKLSDRNALLASAGPTWSGGETSYHAYAALGLFF
jgi:hypothetical protein